MAKCPKCGAAQYWSKLTQLDKTKVIVCPICGSQLAMDSQRTTILMGGAFTLLVLPETGLLPFQVNPIWALFVIVVYMPFYFWYLKLNLVNNVELELTQKQEADFIDYARVRKKRKHTGKVILILGILMFVSALPFLGKQLGGVLLPAGMITGMLGFLIFSITRCPFCKKTTVYISSSHGCRCMNCHRVIDVD